MRLCPWSLALASSIPVLGLESVCPRKGCPWPWPQIFFVSLALASSLVSSTPPLLKVALFRNQLRNVYSEKELENIHNKTIFLAVFYARQWLTSANIRDGPSNDRKLFRKLTKTEDCIRKSREGSPRLQPLLVKKARKKFKNHLWYLSERFVFLSLFSANVTISEKQLLWRAMISKYQEKFGNDKHEMPYSANMGQKSLSDFVGKGCWTAFNSFDWTPALSVYQLLH